MLRKQNKINVTQIPRRGKKDECKQQDSLCDTTAKHIQVNTRIIASKLWGISKQMNV